VHVLALILQSDGACYLEVAEAIDLCLAEQVLAQRVDIVALQLLVDVEDMAQLVMEWLSATLLSDLSSLCALVE